MRRSTTVTNQLDALKNRPGKEQENSFLDTNADPQEFLDELTIKLDLGDILKKATQNEKDMHPNIAAATSVYLISTYVIAVAPEYVLVYDQEIDSQVCHFMPKDTKIEQSIKYKAQISTDDMEIALVLDQQSKKSVSSCKIVRGPDSTLKVVLVDLGVELAQPNIKLRQNKEFGSNYIFNYDSEFEHLYLISFPEIKTLHLEDNEMIKRKIIDMDMIVVTQGTSSGKDNLIFYINSKEFDIQYCIYEYTHDLNTLSSAQLISPMRTNNNLTSATLLGQQYYQLVGKGTFYIYDIANDKVISQPLPIDNPKETPLQNVIYYDNNFFYGSVANRLTLFCMGNPSGKTMKRIINDVTLWPDVQFQNILHDNDQKSQRILISNLTIIPKSIAQENQAGALAGMFLKTLSAAPPTRLVRIIPLIHSNQIIPWGAKDLQEYLAVKKVGLKLYALDKDCQITEWNAVTGKLVKKTNTLKVITRSLDQITNIDEIKAKLKGFLRKQQLPVEFHGWKSVIESLDHVQIDSLNPSLDKNVGSVTTYMVIEIQDDLTIKIHLEFQHYIHSEFQFNPNFTLLLATFGDVVHQCEIPEGKYSWKLLNTFKAPKQGATRSYNTSLELAVEEHKEISHGAGGPEFLLKRIINNELKEVAEVDFPKYTKQYTYKFIGKKNIELAFSNDYTIKFGFDEKFKDKGKDSAKKIKKTMIVPQFESEKSVNFFYPLVQKYSRFYRSYYFLGHHHIDMINDEIFSLNESNTQQLILEHSFTFLHLQLAFAIKTNPSLIKDFDTSMIVALAFNIFPHCETALHKLCENGEVIAAIYDSFSQFTTLSKDIPFIKNEKQQTPVHICVEDEHNATLNIFLNKLSSQKLQNSSHLLVDIMPQLININSQYLKAFLDSRIISNPELEKVKRGKLITLYEDQYEYSHSNIVADSSEIKSRIFDEQEGSKLAEANVKLQFLDIPKVHLFREKISQKCMKELAAAEDLSIFTSKSIQQIILLQWPLIKSSTIKKLLIPYVVYLFMFHYFALQVYMPTQPDDKTDWFIHNDTENDYNGLIEPVEKVEKDKNCKVDFKNYTDGNFSLMTKHFMYYPDETDSSWGARYIGIPIMILMALYFVANEFIPFFKSQEKWEYFKEYISSFKTFIDQFTAIVAIILMVFWECDYNNSYVPMLYSLVLMFMWVKMIFFLRLFGGTAHLIRLITQVIFDIKEFLIVLFIAIMAFSNGFLIVYKYQAQINDDFEVNTKSENIITTQFKAFMYTYKLVLGDNKLDDYEAVKFAYVLFLLCSLFNMVIMMNLLISIISETFANIQAQKEQALYSQRASIIAENVHLVPSKSIELGGKQEYLIIVTKVDQAQPPEVLTILEEKMEQLGNDINAKIEAISNEMAQKSKEGGAFQDLIVDQVEQLQSRSIAISDRFTKLQLSVGKLQDTCDQAFNIIGGDFNKNKDHLIKVDEANKEINSIMIKQMNTQFNEAQQSFQANIKEQNSLILTFKDQMEKSIKLMEEKFQQSIAQSNNIIQQMEKDMIHSFQENIQKSNKIVNEMEGKLITITDRIEGKVTNVIDESQNMNKQQDALFKDMQKFQGELKVKNEGIDQKLSMTASSTAEKGDLALKANKELVAKLDQTQKQTVQDLSDELKKAVEVLTKSIQDVKGGHQEESKQEEGKSKKGGAGRKKSGTDDK